MVVDDFATSAGTGMRQEVNCAILLVHGIEGAPAGDVGFVVGSRVVPFHVAAVLVPGKFHPLLRSLHHPLFVEEAGVRANCRRGDLRHQVAENKLPQPLAQPIAVVDEITLAAMRDADGLDTLGIHQGVVIAEVVGTFLAQHFEQVGRDNTRQNQIAFRLVQVALGVGDYVHDA